MTLMVHTGTRAQIMRDALALPLESTDRRRPILKLRF
jgi:hypothetical protein